MLDRNIHHWTERKRKKKEANFIAITHLKYRCMGGQAHRDSGNFVKVARLLVYMCPPTSMCTGALDLVSCAGVGMPWLLKGDTGDRVIMGLDMLERLSCKTQQNIIKSVSKTDGTMPSFLLSSSADPRCADNDEKCTFATTGDLIIKL